MSGERLIPFDPGGLPIDTEDGRVEVRVSEAAAEHLVAWDLDQRVKAVHEAGHAVVAHLLGIPVKSVDISEREVGRTDYALADDTHPAAMPDSRVLDLMVASLAGLAAERAVLGEGTTAGSHDLHAATQLAYRRFEAGLDPQAPFINAEAIGFGLASPALADELQAVARSVLSKARERAEVLVADHRDAIVRFAVDLYGARRLDGVQLLRVLDAALGATGQSPAPGERDEVPASGGTTSWRLPDDPTIGEPK